MIRLYFYKGLQKYTHVAYQDFDISKYSTIPELLNTLFPELEAYLKDIKSGKTSNFIVLIDSNKNLITDRQYLRDDIEENITELWVVPSLFGKGGRDGIIGAVLVAAVIAVSLYTGGAAGGSVFSQMFSATNAGGFFGFAARTVLGIGINMILGSLFSQGLKKPVKPDAPVEQERRNNDMFEGLQNTTDTDKMVQLNYGQVRVAGQLVSGYIETISHGQNDNISVSNYV